MTLNDEFLKEIDENALMFVVNFKIRLKILKNNQILSISNKSIPSKNMPWILTIKNFNLSKFVIIFIKIHLNWKYARIMDLKIS